MKEKLLVILTDCNTISQFTPEYSDHPDKLFQGSEIKSLMDYIHTLQEEGKVVIENKIKRDGYSYGLYLQTSYWYPPQESNREAMVDAPYESVSINISAPDPGGKDVNNRENWDKGYFKLRARVLGTYKPEKEWKENLFRL